MQNTSENVVKKLIDSKIKIFLGFKNKSFNATDSSF